MFLRPLLVVTIGLALAMPASSQSLPVTGADAWRAVVGNTIIGETAAGEALVEYFAPDGVVKNRINGEPDEGQWTLRGDRVCTDYSEDDEEGDDGKDNSDDSSDDEEAVCYALSVQGDNLTLTDESGKVRDFKIMPGNAEKL